MRSISKVFVAAAVAASCGYLSAATVGGGTVTPLGLISAKAAPQTNSYIISGQAAGDGARAASDRRTLTIQTNSISANQAQLKFTSSNVFGSSDTHGATFTCSAGGVAAASVVFNLSSGASNGTTVVYEVASRGTGDVNGATCLLPNLTFLTSSLAAGAQDVTISGTIVNVSAPTVNLDSFTNAKVASINSEFTFAVTSSLDAVIDVQSARLTFASGIDVAVTDTVGTLAYSDNFTISNTRAANTRTTVGESFTGTFQVVLTAGSGSDFGYLQDGPNGSTVTGAGTCSVTTGSGRAGSRADNSDAMATASTITASPTSGSCTTLTVNFNTIAGGNFTIGLGRGALNVNSASATAFAPQTYTAVYRFDSGANSLVSPTSVTAGTWTLNGTTVQLQYVPVGSANLQLFVQNNSNQTGSLTFVAYNKDGASCTGNLGTVNPTASSSFGTALKSALLGTAIAGTTTSCTSAFAVEGRAMVTLTSTSPSASTRVHSGFSVGDTVSRSIIVNSTN